MVHVDDAHKTELDEAPSLTPTPAPSADDSRGADLPATTEDDLDDYRLEARTITPSDPDPATAPSSAVEADLRMGTTTGEPATSSTGSKTEEKTYPGEFGRVMRSGEVDTSMKDLVSNVIPGGELVRGIVGLFRASNLSQEAGSNPELKQAASDLRNESLQRIAYGTLQVVGYATALGLGAAPVGIAMLCAAWYMSNSVNGGVQENLANRGFGSGTDAAEAALTKFSGSKFEDLQKQLKEDGPMRKELKESLEKVMEALPSSPAERKIMLDAWARGVAEKLTEGSRNLPGSPDTSEDSQRLLKRYVMDIEAEVYNAWEARRAA